ncbi:hypothetical protein ACG04R_20600 [Roseateles sp. BYS78W]|uniref:Phage tail protein n=1 Tax=Pelomonas candidula TaxID=3299025 RepID=A0ABW7HGR0_9BURK
MYVFIDKKSKALLHVANASPGDEREPSAFFDKYDPQTMEVGRAIDQFVPAKFAIKKGIVVDLDAPPAETLDQARARKLDEIKLQALTQRGAIAPDYQLLNAGLGIYDDDRVQQLRNTVNAFRAEAERLEALVAKAKTVADVDAVTAKFPTALVTAKPAPKSRSKSG